MGNRNGSSRRKQRDSAYSYSNARGPGPTNTINGAGNINRGILQKQTSIQQYQDGYGTNVRNQIPNNYDGGIASKSFFFL